LPFTPNFLLYNTQVTYSILRKIKISGRAIIYALSSVGRAIRSLRGTKVHEKSRGHAQ
jgi:hypothetical protein